MASAFSPLCAPPSLARATPPEIAEISEGALPKLRAPAKPAPLAPTVGGASVLASLELGELRAAMAREVPRAAHPRPQDVADAAARASIMLAQTGQLLDTPQLLITVDRNPARQMLYLFLAGPGGWQKFRLVGADHVSTGQAGRKDYYITPVGVFPHTDAILDFRAAGTFNEHHVRGLGLAGMRVWDFGWQWAKKGWHTDGEGGDIRLGMHATDPTYLEARLGHPASEGCVRISAAMNQFLDKHGVLDADYEQAALRDVRYNALLRSDRTPSLLAGRLLVVIDTTLPKDTPPTAQSRPADWPAPPPANPDQTMSY
jgi:hypothetical protein